MQPQSPGVHQDPEQSGPSPNAADPSPAGENEVAGPEDTAALAALEDRLRRTVADLENLRKRHARELDRQRVAEANRLAAAWLPVVDNLDLALSYADADPSAIIEGVQKVRDQALAVLASLGFARHDEVGVPFDPAQHEVVNVVDDSEAEPGTVVRVLRPGYGTAERQLRPGAVTVAGRRG
jgi:molecular chaperone GrpE